MEKKMSVDSSSAIPVSLATGEKQQNELMYNPKEKPKNVEKSDGDEKLPYPKSVFFIVVNEFCERFNYYGMRTVLTLYMRNILKFDEDLSTVLYHLFIMLCYFTPILGAIIADTYLGKFTTILSLSIFYAIGSILLSVAAIPNFLPQTAFSMLGLFIIALGTGGIKPCVSAFGGDQFVRPQQDRQLESFFSVFYFAINAGSLISTFVTPILREDVKCFGEDSCFSLAFGVPAILMVVAVVVFVIGKPLYTIKKPEGNVMGDFARCIGRAIKRKVTVKDEKHAHWLDFASDEYSQQLIDEVKRVLAVTLVFVPLPVFWALYDQQGSRWTFQATRMNGDLGGWVLKPDQMQIVNPLLILIMVPIFESVIYPLFKRCGLLTPLQRIGCGLIFCGLSFVLSAFVEIALEPTYAKIPGSGLTKLNFINTLPCDVDLNYKVGDGMSGYLTVNASQYTFLESLPANELITIANATARNGTECNNLNLNQIVLGEGEETHGYSVIISRKESEMFALRMNEKEQLEKSVSGEPYLGFFYDLTEDCADSVTPGEIIVSRAGSTNYTYFYNGTAQTTPAKDPSGCSPAFIQTEYQEVGIGSYDIHLSGVNGSIGKIDKLIQGGVYRIVIRKSRQNNGNVKNEVIMTVEVTSPNTVSILWLLPQYVVVTIGEVLFSVTGLTFSFTEAPVTMKSVMQGIWQLVVAFGNLIVIIVAEAKSGLSQRDEFFVFAGIMGVATVIFAVLAMRYKYVENEKTDEKEMGDVKKKVSNVSNLSSSSSSSLDDAYV